MAAVVLRAAADAAAEAAAEAHPVPGDSPRATAHPEPTRAVILPELGGVAASLRVAGVEVLCRTPWADTIRPAADATPAPDEDSWVARWGGGWQLCAPTAGQPDRSVGETFHGVASQAPWAVDAVDAASVSLVWSDPAGLTLTRTWSVLADGLAVRTVASNTGAAARVLTVAEHLILGADLLAGVRAGTAAGRLAVPPGVVLHELDYAGRPLGVAGGAGVAGCAGCAGGTGVAGGAGVAADAAGATDAGDSSGAGGATDAGDSTGAGGAGITGAVARGAAPQSPGQPWPGAPAARWDRVDAGTPARVAGLSGFATQASAVAAVTFHVDSLRAEVTWSGLPCALLWEELGVTQEAPWAGGVVALGIEPASTPHGAGSQWGDAPLLQPGESREWGVRLRVHRGGTLRA